MKLKQKLICGVVGLSIASTALISVVGCKTEKEEQHLVEPTDQQKIQQPSYGVTEVEYQFQLLTDMRLCDLSTELFASSQSGQDISDLINFSCTKIENQILTCSVAWKSRPLITKTVNFGVKFTNISENWTQSMSGFSLTYTAPGRISSAVIHDNPTKMEYNYGDKLDLSGLTFDVVSAETGETSNIPYDKTTIYSYPANGEELYTTSAYQTIIIYVDDQLVLLTVDVKPIPLAADAKWNKVYTTGDTLNKSDIHLTAYYSDNTTKEVDQNKWTAQPSLEQPVVLEEKGVHNYEIKVTGYEDYGIDAGINVDEAFVTSVSATAVTTRFVPNQVIDADNFVISATYSDGSVKVIPYDDCVSNKPLPYIVQDSDVGTTLDITFTYQGKQTPAISLSLEEPVLSNLKVTPNRNFFAVNDNISINDYKVTADIEGIGQNIELKQGLGKWQFQVLNPKDSSTELTLPHAITSTDYTDWTGGGGTFVLPVKCSGVSVSSNPITLYETSTVTDVMVIPKKSRYKLGEQLTKDDIAIQVSYKVDSNTYTSVYPYNDQDFQLNVSLPYTFNKSGSQTFTVKRKVSGTVKAQTQFSLYVDEGALKSLTVKVLKKDHEVNDYSEAKAGNLRSSDIQVQANYVGNISRILNYETAEAVGYTVEDEDGNDIDLSQEIGYGPFTEVGTKKFYACYQGVKQQFQIVVTNPQSIFLSFAPGVESEETESWTKEVTRNTTIGDAADRIPLYDEKSYTFKGWTDVQGTPAWDPTTPITQSTQFYAVYESNVKLEYCTKAVVGTSTKLSLVSTSTNIPKVLYSLDNGSIWNQLTTTPIVIPANSTIYLRSKNKNGWSSQSARNTIRFSGGEVALSGNICSLINGGSQPTAQTTGFSEYCFANAFAGSTGITYVDKDFIKVNALTKGMFEKCFANCSNLSTAPDLPEQDLQEYCYNQMFTQCTSLIEPPSNIDDTCDWYTSYPTSCFQSMFENCIQLDHPFPLKTFDASQYKTNCFTKMYYKCNSLQITKDDPADTDRFFVKMPKKTVSNCAINMFDWFSGFSIYEKPNENCDYYFAQNSNNGVTRSISNVLSLQYVIPYYHTRYCWHDMNKSEMVAERWDWAPQFNHLVYGNHLMHDYREKTDFTHSAYSRIKINYLLQPGETKTVKLNMKFTAYAQSNASRLWADTWNNVVLYVNYYGTGAYPNNTLIYLPASWKEWDQPAKKGPSVTYYVQLSAGLYFASTSITKNWTMTMHFINTSNVPKVISHNFELITGVQGNDANYENLYGDKRGTGNFWMTLEDL